MRLSARLLVATSLSLFAAASALRGQLPAQLPTQLPTQLQPDPSLLAPLQYRLIGPFRGGRTVGAQGIPEQPNVFYVGVTDGGVWKTADAGRTWNPIFDAQSTGSIGTLAIAPSDPNVIYVGSGEGLRRPDLSLGNGIYKSIDAGATWKHMGLADGQQIASIIVDPHDPNRLFVAVLGHPYGPNAERGIFRSTDGGTTWRKVLYKDENTGGVDLAFDPTNANTVYASLWASRRPPWTVGNPYDGDGSGLFRSTDGGTTWHQIGRGLPSRAQKLGRIGITVAPNDPRRMYAMVDADPDTAGVYRSDDAGESWTRVNDEKRVWDRGNDFAWVRADPQNADVVYVCNTSTYRSTDGGKSFTAIKGAPGGDDYHAIWINPNHPEIMLLAVDQGATITVNGGRTWSSWYNQPTAQLYHVTTDDRFPYWVYGGQQESGSVGIASRGDAGEITFRDWYPVGIEEYGYAAPDPLNPDIVYGGKVTRFDHRTHQTQNVAPEPVRSGKYRFNRTAPLIFEYADPHALLLGSNVLLETINGGDSWTTISPDLSRANAPSPAALGPFVNADPAHGKHGGVIYSIAPSHRDAKVIWVGTDDGLIQLTRDGGKTWTNVTPPAITPWSKVAQLDASHWDDETVYAAVNRIRLDDLHPHIWRTHDGGRTWAEIVTGIPADEPVNVVREDPVRRGLLYAGTENTVYVSFDDGAHWQSLRRNLPPSSIRDLVVKDSDLVIGTHGRSIWIMDDVTPLRQLTPELLATMTPNGSARAHLFAPAEAFRIQRDINTDTPLPPEEPHGQNPPEGAIIDYWLRDTPRSPITLEIVDARGHVVRHFSSADTAARAIERGIDSLDVPAYWPRHPRVVSTAPGMHRFTWDLHAADPDVLVHEYPISAVPGDTPREPRGATALPGRYTVRLTVDGTTYTQPLVVHMDPRVKASMADLQAQHDAATRLQADIERDFTAIAEARALSDAITHARAQGKPNAAVKGGAPGATVKAAVDSLTAEVQAAAGQGPRARGRGASLSSINGDLASLLTTVDGADARPTAATMAGIDRIEQELSKQLDAWNRTKARLPKLNTALNDLGAPTLQIPTDLTPWRTELQRAESADKDRDEP